ncbi:hypothetical protein OUZ56_029327 [Daphnia magna]|uniref:Uncharacterized protein n=1 Tax=Daphnia magna TaxID=35525 RepID=A0ABR0B6I4_9CRUS|nr:hypothetical protein OUZ56_029327 [Daphnia magna]
MFNLTIHGNLAVEETFNNLNIPQGITLLNRFIRHSGTLFTSNVTVYGDVVSSAGYVIALSMEAGVMLDDFVAAAATIDEDATIIEHITIHGHVTFRVSFETDTINSCKVEEYLSQGLRATNAQNLTDFVLIAGTSDVQPITGPMDIQRVTGENSLKIEDHLVGLSIQNGSLLLDQPSENNPDLAIVSLRALRKDRAQAITVIYNHFVSSLKKRIPAAACFIRAYCGAVIVCLQNCEIASLKNVLSTEK